VTAPAVGATIRAAGSLAVRVDLLVFVISGDRHG
jgi:hypothetical protein